MKKHLLAFVFFGGLLVASGVFAQYNVVSSVMSGGGGTSESASFKNSGTIGQPTPLETEADAASSYSFLNQPGFWYTVDAVVSCDSAASMAAAFGSVNGDSGYNVMCDFDKDGDVDGLDLLEFSTMD